MQSWKFRCCAPNECAKILEYWQQVSSRGQFQLPATADLFSNCYLEIRPAMPDRMMNFRATDADIGQHCVGHFHQFTFGTGCRVHMGDTGNPSADPLN